MPTRIFPFLLRVQRFGAPKPVDLAFFSREMMLAYIRGQQKQHFIGSMVPLVWREGDYEPDTMTSEKLADSGLRERNQLFLNTAELLRQMATLEGELTLDNKVELFDAISLLFGVVDIPLPQVEEAVEHSEQALSDYERGVDGTTLERDNGKYEEEEEVAHQV